MCTAAGTPLNQTPAVIISAMDDTSHPRLAGKIFDAALILLILTGLFLRFNWVNWSQGTNLHPDEYGLTNTLTQLAIPASLADYFNTRLSPLSPYQKYDLAGAPTQSGPDNRMRWGQLPITIIRLAGELSGNTGYDEIRLLGRQLSALADTLVLLLIFLIGEKLYSYRAGLLAAAFSALAVMQIQQSHFMTVDNFGSLFTTLGLYACVQIASRRQATAEPEAGQFILSTWAWHLLFGVTFGLALACKVNLLPVGGLLLVAAFIRLTAVKTDFRRAVLMEIALLALAFISAGMVFRLAQPMSFRAAQGDTSILTLHPNQDWVDSMQVASDESSGVGGGPPGEQWAHRPAILFPLTNMVVWGLGLPLGLAAWLGFAAAGWQALVKRRNWQAHLLPLVWSGGYFLFMGTRWVKSVRYFLPIYPFLCLFAAWGLLELWQWSTRPAASGRRPYRVWLSAGLTGLVVLGSLAWALAFTRAVYQTPNTRIAAARWIFDNIPGPFQLGLQQDDGTITHEPLPAPDGLQVSSASPSAISFSLKTGGTLFQVHLPHIQASRPGTLNLLIAADAAGTRPLAAGSTPVSLLPGQVTAKFTPIRLQPGTTYYLIASSPDDTSLTISRAVIANESWDEGLPMPLDGRDPFGNLYRGLTMEVRWPDDAHKREVLLNTLAAADYLILPSQRAIWSTCRIPLTYPLTLEYYRALFDGRLGFDLAASFTTPFKLGPLWISDVGGIFAWNKTPSLPLFNHSWLAAEEAFSVYDHPPVWIFKKRADFSLDNASKILSSVDLSRVVYQTALNAQGDWCPPQ